MPQIGDFRAESKKLTRSPQRVCVWERKLTMGRMERGLMGAATNIRDIFSVGAVVVFCKLLFGAMLGRLTCAAVR